MRAIQPGRSRSSPPSGGVPIASAKKRILIVEDDRVIALDLRQALDELGYLVVGIAGSSDEALRKASEVLPDLILMDIRLDGDLDGIETAALLRARSPTPIVYLTANADSDTLARALETEPCGYVAKPYSLRTLRASIEVAFRQHQSERVLRCENEVLIDQKRALEQRADELGDLAERFRQESIHDPLSGLYNRRHLEAALAREIDLARRGGHAVGMMVFDVDHFKSLNDTFGHAAGDIVLREVAQLLSSRLRTYDIVCRYGGDEIVVVAPGASLSDTCELAEDLRVEVAALIVLDNDGQLMSPITVSIGVAEFPEHGDLPEHLFNAADAALYRAKHEGRNRVVAATRAV